MSEQKKWFPGSPALVEFDNGVRAFVDGPLCPKDGQKHDFSGWEEGEGWASSKCVKCGTLAMNYDVMYGP